MFVLFSVPAADGKFAKPIDLTPWKETGLTDTHRASVFWRVDTLGPEFYAEDGTRAYQQNLAQEPANCDWLYTAYIPDAYVWQDDAVMQLFHMLTVQFDLPARLVTVLETGATTPADRFVPDDYWAQVHRHFRERIILPPGCRWQHHSGRLYRIDGIYNATSDRAKFPLTVAYHNEVNKARFCRPAREFFDSFAYAPYDLIG